MAPTPLGDYLRSRRADVRPADVGLPVGRSRRVAGLRREEVALLAEVSVDYYVRLEQGRERHPSAQVLDALAAALRLDDDGRLHLFRLAGLAPKPTSDRPEHVDPDLRRLLDGWPDTPALVLSRVYDVLARNRLGEALFAPFTHSDNLLLNMFLDPAARAFYQNWQHAAVNTVAGFRLAAGEVPDDPRVRAVISEADASSSSFRELWARNEARGKSAEVKTFVHPEVGPITLRMQTFDVRSAPGQQLIVYHAEPGSRSAHALTLLQATITPALLGKTQPVIRPFATSATAVDDDTPQLTRNRTGSYSI
ncbi:helix-turn-helix transcriptional regulator [Amycolatopsis sp. H20-H5]|uniref:helix-turn-helix transcriptional regulator n=1 Tax=Amycolatopsis sp. H20-H5 TaxID=3046309 RepID=UPI002DB89332|nr:helix-turn-helix transcriptional regulator [Amycolatopsis sp. H20-H5]MEC3975905.1 helix-turn-helix transcriptional regulator [Amycolatopsis sp. H20-H5]